MNFADKMTQEEVDDMFEEFELNWSYINSLDNATFAIDNNVNMLKNVKG